MNLNQTFTRDFMNNNKGCYTETNLAKMYADNQFGLLISLDNILQSNIPLKDKYWFVCNKVATKKQNQLIAIGCAEIVLDIYEKKYPNNKAPKEAIQAAKDYLAEIIDIGVLKQKRDAAADAADADAAAAYVAHAAAYAANAAYAAAYAANAANAAAYAANAAADAAAYAANAAIAVYAADAVYAAAYAAYAAYTAAYAADAKDYKQILLEFLINFIKNN